MLDELLDRFASEHGVPDDLKRAIGDLLRTAIIKAHGTVATFVPVDGDADDDEPPVTVRLPAGLTDPLAADETTEEAGALDSLTHASRYHDLGLIGVGGMGEVRRVRDLELNRVVAMKILRDDLDHHVPTVARFIEEAQATAQLEHPGIVPVHELGRLPDGRLYFTMKKVRGRTLGEVIDEVHVASTGVDWAPGPSGWSFTRLIDAFHRVCESVAYAHARHVLHRDLKPSNVMVGEYGEVLVLDWGLAKVMGRPDALEVDGAVEVDGLALHADDPDDLRTRTGSVFGTPSYMAPEQARGEMDKLGPTADVYSLGALLYEILSGDRPYGRQTSRKVLKQVLAGPPAPLDLRHAVPDVLVLICHRAMSRDAESRYPDAGALAREVGDWLEGSRRREQALEAIQRADGLGPHVSELRQRAASLRRSAEELLAPLPPTAPVDRKRSGWALEDHAATLEREADVLDVTRTQFLYAALSHAPELSLAHQRLAEHFRNLHAQAEAAREQATAARLEAVLRSHVEQLDAGAPAGLRAYLDGRGALTVHTDPPGAKVELFRYVDRDRRSDPDRVSDLGRTPLDAVELDAGSYLLQLRAPGRAEVSYPVRIAREAHWDGVPPGESTPLPVFLPRASDLSRDERYVPGGWFASGGDPRASGALSRRRIWLDAFVVKAFPVTHAQYLQFLEALLEADEVNDALWFAPRAADGAPDDDEDLLYAWMGDRFVTDARVSGHVTLEHQPVVGVDWHGARAWASFYAEASKLPWRLPAELEWEKAARGVDGRFFPWGDHLDPTFCCMRDSHVGAAGLAVVESFPVDSSPYGVRGMAGNVFEWTADPYLPEGPEVVQGRAVPVEGAGRVPRVARGGGWRSPSRYIRTASRVRNDPRLRAPDLGFRVVRSLVDGTAAPHR